MSNVAAFKTSDGEFRNNLIKISEPFIKNMKFYSVLGIIYHLSIIVTFILESLLFVNIDYQNLNIQTSVILLLSVSFTVATLLWITTLVNTYKIVSIMAKESRDTEFGNVYISRYTLLVLKNIYKDMSMVYGLMILLSIISVYVFTFDPKIVTVLGFNFMYSDPILISVILGLWVFTKTMFIRTDMNNMLEFKAK